MMIDLRMPYLRKVPVGTIVITSKGFEFQLITRSDWFESWKDLTSGLTWILNLDDKTYNHYEAVEKYADTLPAQDEFKLAEEHGFREVLGIEEGWYWSSSVYPGAYEDGAYYFNGDYGNVGFGNRFNFYGSVVCVSR